MANKNGSRLRPKSKQSSSLILLFALVVVGGAIAYLVSQGDINFSFQAAGQEREVVYASTSKGSVANEVGGEVEVKDAQQEVWLGSDSTTESSYLGLRFNGPAMAPNATIVKAELRLTAYGDQNNAIATVIYGEKAAASAFFTTQKGPSTRIATDTFVAFNQSKPWKDNTVYTVDVTTVVQEIVEANEEKALNAVTLVVKSAQNDDARRLLRNAQLAITYRQP